MKRRTFFVTVFSIPTAALAQAESAIRLAILTDLVKAIGAAGDAISKLTEGFKTLVVAGNDSYNYIAAERERARLIDISRRTAQLIATRNVLVIESIAQYLEAPKRRQEDWSRVVVHVDDTLNSVKLLLSDVQQEDGSFILEPAYLTLNEVLSGRVRLLDQLAAMRAPESREELALLSAANEKYKTLVARATVAVTELNTYVKGKK